MLCDKHSVRVLIDRQLTPKANDTEHLWPFDAEKPACVWRNGSSPDTTPFVCGGTDTSLLMRSASLTVTGDLR